MGKTLSLGVSPGSDRVGGTIVGIVGDVRAAGLHRDPPATIYVLLPQVTTSEMTFVVRATQAPGSVITGARRVIEARDRDIVVDRVQTLRDVVAKSLGRPRFIAELLTLFAGLAVVLAGVGIYGVVSYGVAQRTREIGVRLALGADRARVTRTVVGQEIRWAIAGLALGAIATSIAIPVLSSVVFGLDPRAPLIQIAATGGLLLVALAACFVPARRAAGASPLTAIRAE
jgi:predicted lysophospholipase L1 biosynthesis ABC-type transport system permease subunit